MNDQSAVSPRAVAVFLQATALCLRNWQTPASNRDWNCLFQERVEIAVRAQDGLRLTDEDVVHLHHMAEALESYLLGSAFAIADPSEGSS